MSYNENFSQSGSSNETDTIIIENISMTDVEFDLIEDEKIDLNQIQLEDDETWLYEPNHCFEAISSASTSPKTALNEQTVDTQAKKLINTQTFTRPKKKFLRPSIDKINQELFADNNEQQESQFVINPSMKPLEFDLSQSINTNYFNNMAVVNSNVEDSFQNMSPPSLVNSMCSSTFTNLMESSFIKNDPELREICDRDFTTSILSQGSEPPSLIHSLSYSTNSIDDFLNKVSQQDENVMKMMMDNNLKCSGDASYIVHKKDSFKEHEKNMSNIMDYEEYHDASSDIQQGPTKVNHNGTYRRSTKLSSATFRKSDSNRQIARHQTYEIDPKDIQEAQNMTLTFESPKSTKNSNKSNESVVKSNSVENLKNNTTILKDSCNNDLERFDLKENYVDIGANLSSKSGSKKSLDCSMGSADSLDRMSTLSSSSKGSNKMLNMEEVEAIAEKQEQSLRIMSTPKTNWSSKVLNRIMWDHSVISPIVTGDLQSDSGESSDDYKSVKSTFSKNSGEGSTRPVKQTRSLVSLQDPADARKLKSMNVLTNDIKNFKPGGSKMPQTMRVNSTGSMVPPSNLKTMRSTLKGSYTSLRPVNACLPVAPPINSSGGDATYVAPASLLAAQNHGERKADNPVFARPTAGPIRSGLPRPTMTSIPRPVSKIPGPRRFTSQKNDKIGT